MSGFLAVENTSILLLTARKIQISLATKALLDTLIGFEVEERGEVNVKGKGMEVTFWLLAGQELSGQRQEWSTWSYTHVQHTVNNDRRPLYCVKEPHIDISGTGLSFSAKHIPDRIAFIPLVLESIKLITHGTFSVYCSHAYELIYAWKYLFQDAYVLCNGRFRRCLSPHHSVHSYSIVVA